MTQPPHYICCLTPPRLIQPLPVSRSINLSVSVPVIFQKGRDYEVVTLYKILRQKESLLNSVIDFLPLMIHSVYTKSIWIFRAENEALLPTLMFIVLL